MASSGAKTHRVEVELPSEAFGHHPWEPDQLSQELRNLWLLEQVRQRRLAFTKARGPSRRSLTGLLDCFTCSNPNRPSARITSAPLSALRLPGTPQRFHCKPTHEGRFFKRPDEDDLARYAEAEGRLAQAAGRLRRFIPSPGRSCARLGWYDSGPMEE